MTAISELLKRVREATGPDRELDGLERRSPTTFGHLICRVDALKSLKGEH